MTHDVTPQQVALLEGLHNLYRAGTLTDVTLRTSSQDEIRCHRSVLAASSPYFRAMFTSPVKERDAADILLHDVKPTSLSAVISFMYSGRLELTNEIVQDIFMTASMFEMIPLLDMCASKMVQELCIFNCVDIFNFGSHFGCKSLKESARAYILEHFTNIIEESDKLFELDYEEFRDIISRDGIYVEKEERVYEAMMDWVMCAREQRLQYLPTLFKEIRLALISVEYLETVVMENKFILNDAFCREVLTYHTVSKIGKEMSTDSGEDVILGEMFGLNCSPRLGMFNKTMVVFSGGGNSPDERSLTAFDPVSNKNYTGMKSHPTFDFKYKIDFFQLKTTHSNSIYFLGGIFYDNHHFEDAGSALRDVFEYKIREMTWERKAPMNVARCCFSVCTHNNTLYVTGGKPTYPRGEPSDSLEMYDHENNYWSRLSPLPIPIYCHASAAVSDAIFVFGGKDEDDQFLDTVFRYDLLRDTWTLVTTQMAKPRAQFSAMPYKGKVYLVGGSTLHENILRVDIFNPEKNTWQCGEEFPEERKITSASIQGGFIYLCGGVRYLGLSGRRSRKVESRDLYRYDIEKSVWTKEVKLVQFGNSHDCAIAVLNTQYLESSDFISSA